MKPDIIICWPDNCDYPLWRKMIREEKDRFGKIIIIFTKTNNVFNYKKFVISQLTDIAYMYDSPDVLPGQDWRDVATNFALKQSNSSWIWFTEQDFYPNEKFWIEFDFIIQKGYISGAYSGDRLHPCSILINRLMIEVTRKDFSPIPNIADHFSKIQEDLKPYTIVRLCSDTYEHLNGLSSNFSLISGGLPPNYEPDRFKKYIEDCMNCDIVLDKDFVTVCNNYLYL